MESIRSGSATGMVLGLVILGGCLAADPAIAIPRYAARYEQKCALCHIDPSGGGQRTLYAVQFLVPAEMAFATGARDEGFLPDPQVGENLTIGLDMRTLFIDSDGGRHPQNFLQMQGDLYLTFQLSEHVRAYIDRGMSGSYELYGLAHILPWNGVLKTGRFAPAFGWRFADHTAFVRDYQGFAPPGHSDVGVELGFFPGHLELQVGLLNGSRGSVRDTDNDLAVAARALLRGNLQGIGLSAGGSFHRQDRTGGESTLAGIIGSVRIRSFIWLAETDWHRLESAGGETTAWTVSQQFAIRLQRGLDALATYDFHDPDTALRGGALARWGAGMDLLAYPFLHLRLMLSHYDYRDGDLLQGKDHQLLEGQIHFLY